MARHSDFIKNEAKLATDGLRRHIADVCDKVYRGDKYRRQWGFIEIMKESIVLMNNMTEELEYQEQEIKQREDNMYRYLQDENCPKCGEISCKKHCNFHSCGADIKWFDEQGYQYVASGGRVYPQNYDSSPHILCDWQRKLPKDKYIAKLRELFTKEGIQWKKKER